VPKRNRILTVINSSPRHPRLSVLGGALTERWPVVRVSLLVDRVFLRVHRGLSPVSVVSYYQKMTKLAYSH
jgi:hypothetical protein